MKRNIIIDDAIVIAIAIFNLIINVELITTVAGNVGIDYVTQNTLTLLHFFEKNAPVAKGAASPLLEPFEDASNIHGKTGLDRYDFNWKNNYSLLLEQIVVKAMQTCILQSKEKIILMPIYCLTFFNVPRSKT